MKVDLYPYYKMLMEKGIILSYCGPMMQEGIEGIAATLKDKLAAESLPPSASMAIFSIFIEQIQNVMNYSAERHTEVDKTTDAPRSFPSGVFVIGRAENAYYTECGNHVRNSEIERISANIDYINSLNKDELKAYYRERRKAENDNPESRGAGLGLIEIARRSTAPLEYEFTRLDDEKSFFSLFATVLIG